MSRRQQLIDEYAALDFVDASSFKGTNWFEAHEAWASPGAFNSSQTYLASLRSFAANATGGKYADHIVFGDDGGVRATRIDVVWERGTTAEVTLHRMHKSRRVIHRAAPSLRPLVADEKFIWASGLDGIFTWTSRSLALSCGAIAVVLLVLLGDMFAVTLTSFCIFTVGLATFGAIYFFNDRLHTWTSFFIVIAVGLAADAPAHICHAYLHAPEHLDSKERAFLALTRLGPSVFDAGISTLAGFCILAGCESYLFLIFFKYLSLIIGLSCFFGLTFVPVVLAYAPRQGPPTPVNIVLRLTQERV